VHFTTGFLMLLSKALSISDCRQIRQLLPILAAVAEFGDSCRIRRQCGQALMVTLCDMKHLCRQAVSALCSKANSRYALSMQYRVVLTEC